MRDNGTNRVFRRDLQHFVRFFVHFAKPCFVAMPIVLNLKRVPLGELSKDTAILLPQHLESVVGAMFFVAPLALHHQVPCHKRIPTGC